MAEHAQVSVKLKDGTPALIRMANESDAEALLGHMKSLLDDGEGMIVSFDEMKKTVEQEIDWINDLNSHHDNLLLILCVDDEIVAYIDFHANKRRTLAHHGWFGMGVKPGWRGKGAGSVLLDTLIAWAKANPRVDKINLNVRADSSPGITLYKSRGFKEEGVFHKQLKLSDGKYVDDIGMAIWVGS
jgi:RimJ/RimL family protein N-acetyltransferase